MHAHAPAPVTSRQGPARRQWGGDTVEFTLFAAMIFLLLFAIAEFAVAMYDQGALLHSARVGAREASLYWIDVRQLTPDSDPGSDQRIKPAEVERAVSSFTDSFLFGFDGQQAELTLQSQPIGNLGDTMPVSPGDQVDLQLSYVYRAPVTGALARLMDLSMSARGVMRVE